MRRESLFQRQGTQFMKTLNKGFTSVKEKEGSVAAALSSHRTGAGKEGPDEFQQRAIELQEEIDELHKIIGEEHGHDSVLKSYMAQVQRKEKLLLERDAKLNEMMEKNGIVE